MEAVDVKKNDMKKPAIEAKQASQPVMEKAPMNGMPPQEGGSFFDKFPFLKKWWFWAAIGGVILAIFLVVFFLL